jgi:hypothetical protein
MQYLRLPRPVVAPTSPVGTRTGEPDDWTVRSKRLHDLSCPLQIPSLLRRLSGLLGKREQEALLIPVEEER